MKFMQDVEAVEENEIKTESGERVYELGYLLVPTIAEEDVPASYSNIKDLVSTLGGMVISDEMPRMIPLAYSMVKVVSNVRNKLNTGYFGWTKFTMDAEKVLDLKKKLDLDPTIIRFLILKTVKENTIASKRFVRGDVMHKKPTTKKEDEGEALPINKEEIDKEIDALVEA